MRRPASMLSMCYSAQIQADWKRYTRAYGTNLSLTEFYDLFYRRLHEDRKIRVPKAVEVGFADPQNEQERAIAALVTEHRADEATLEQELFNQRRRLADADRSLQAKPTKTASESK